MRPKSILLLTLALGCGLVASIGISQVLEHRNAQPAATTEMQPIFVALNEIGPHSVVTPQSIKLEEWPKDKVPPNAITKLEDIEGKRTKIRIFAGEPILTGKLIGMGEVDGASGQIPKGYRVVAVRVDAVSGGSSLILPGDRVDVLVYIGRNPGNGIVDTSVKTILQDISVFAVDTITSAARKNDKEEAVITAKTISLLVTPGQAEKVTMATELGSIRLVMRSPEDQGEGETYGTSVSQLLDSGGSKGDRNEEEQANEPEPTPIAATPGTNRLIDILKEHAPAGTPTLPGGAAPTNWRMVLMEGSTVREVQFQEDGVTFTEINRDGSSSPSSEPVNSPPATPSGEAPAAESPAEAPSEPVLSGENQG